MLRAASIYACFRDSVYDEPILFLTYTRKEYVRWSTVCVVLSSVEPNLGVMPIDPSGPVPFSHTELKTTQTVLRQTDVLAYD